MRINMFLFFIIKRKNCLLGIKVNTGEFVDLEENKAQKKWTDADLKRPVPFSREELERIL